MPKTIYFVPQAERGLYGLRDRRVTRRGKDRLRTAGFGIRKELSDIVLEKPLLIFHDGNYVSLLTAEALAQCLVPLETRLEQRVYASHRQQFQRVIEEIPQAGIIVAPRWEISKYLNVNYGKRYAKPYYTYRLE